MLTGFLYASRAIQGAREAQEDSCRFALIEAISEGTVALERRIARQKPPTLLAVLADGMGGHAGGAEASGVACGAFVAAFEAEAGAYRSRLAAALDTANRAISQDLQRDPALAGMGCTLVAAVFAEDGVLWVSVGDSPMFLFRRSRLFQVNEDHSLAPVLDRLAALGEMSQGDAEQHPRRHHLRAALTGEPIELVDLSNAAEPLHDGDIVLLASDGLDSLSHLEIADLLAVQTEDSPDLVADALLAAVVAKALPHQDNATVMVVMPVFAT